jgi:4-amino-4-deoxy-L-arabinose transferase-like glycosyltransferase
MRKALLIVALLIPLLGAIFLYRLDDLENYHGDENTWIAISTQAFQLFFVRRDYANPFWFKEYSSWGSYQPQIGKYVIGAGTAVAGYRDIPLVWFRFDQSVSWNIEHRIIYDSAIVRAARMPVALLGAVSCLLLYWLVTLIADWRYGVLAVVALLGMRLIIISSRRAMIDTPALFFSLVALVCLVYLLRAIQAGRDRAALSWAVATGLASGLACASKLNALMALGTCEVALLVNAAIAREWRRKVLLHGICAVLVILWAWLIFFSSNPFLYSDPIAGVRHMLGLAQFLVDHPTPWSTPLLTDKLRVLWRNTLYYEPLRQLGLPGGAWLLLAGCVGLAATAWQAPRQFWERGLGAISIWIVLSYIAIAIWLPFDYDRYFLPLQPGNAFLQVFGLIWLVEISWAFLRRRRGQLQDQAV